MTKFTQLSVDRQLRNLNHIAGGRRRLSSGCASMPHSSCLPCISGMLCAYLFGWAQALAPLQCKAFDHGLGANGFFLA